MYTTVFIPTQHAPLNVSRSLDRCLKPCGPKPFSLTSSFARKSPGQTACDRHGPHSTELLPVLWQKVPPRRRHFIKHANPETSFRKQQEVGRTNPAARPGFLHEALAAAIAKLPMDWVLGQPGPSEPDCRTLAWGIIRAPECREPGGSYGSELLVRPAVCRRYP